ncbi:MAG: nucleoside triphosphate hydrolase [Actinobacteria bacterium]|nr:nucleoside triphosphate hydrolase [Actinomycetota bacterium]
MNTGGAEGSKLSGIESARETVRRMAAPGGCAWHEVQTHESLIPFLIEETAEFVDAVERGLPAEEVAGELGDVLYQVLFHAAIAERDGEGYDLNSVGARLSEKLQARHPHVFGDRGYMTVDELNSEWERLKEDAAGERRGSRGALDGIPAGMPTLARSAKVVERLKRAKLLEVDAPLALEQGADSSQASASSTSEEAIGGEILALVIKANAAGVDPDRALRLATERLARALIDSERSGE